MFAKRIMGNETPLLRKAGLLNIDLNDIPQFCPYILCTVGDRNMETSRAFLLKPSERFMESAW